MKIEFQKKEKQTVNFGVLRVGDTFVQRSGQVYMKTSLSTHNDNCISIGESPITYIFDGLAPCIKVESKVVILKEI